MDATQSSYCRAYCAKSSNLAIRSWYGHEMVCYVTFRMCFISFSILFSIRFLSFNSDVDIHIHVSFFSIPFLYVGHNVLKRSCFVLLYSIIFTTHNGNDNNNNNNQNRLTFIQINKRRTKCFNLICTITSKWMDIKRQQMNQPWASAFVVHHSIALQMHTWLALQ